MWLTAYFFKVKVDDEAARFNAESGQEKESLHSISVKVTNQNLDGLTLIEVPGFSDEEVVCSRLKREDMEIVPKASTEIRTNDIFAISGR